MGLADQATLNFNNKMSTAAVCLDIEKAFDSTWHHGLSYNLSKLEFSTSIIKLISSFRRLDGRRNVYTKVHICKQECDKVLSCLCNLYVNGTPQTHGVHLALFLNNTSLYVTERMEGYVLRKIQCGLNSMAV
jgi:hypothetical protein